MAWNDPPSFDYQQLSNSGRKFKHRYVLDSKLGQQPQQHQQQYQQQVPQIQSNLIHHNNLHQQPHQSYQQQVQNPQPPVGQIIENSANNTIPGTNYMNNGSSYPAQPPPPLQMPYPPQQQ